MAEGLYIFVSPKGSKVWRIDYRFEGKYKTLTVGKYPNISLVEARKKLAEVKEKLAHELDPQEEKKALAQAEKDARENTFEQVTRMCTAQCSATLRTKLQLVCFQTHTKSNTFLHWQGL